MGTSSVEAVDKLLRERLGDRFAVFFDSPEGKLLSDGEEEESGMVIDSSGRVFSYWYGWDDEKQEAALTEWEEIEPKDRWLRQPEYLDARRSLGLPVPPQPRHPLPSGA